MIALAGVSLLIFSAPRASAQEDLTQTILSNIGLAPRDAPDIDYRERAPLVVPPSPDMLPPPRDASTVASDPAWPKDADVSRREKERAEQKRKPRTQIDDARADAKALSPSEMARGHASPGARRAPVKPADEQRDWLHPKFLDFTGWGNKKTEQPMVFAGEPDRDSLTQPPPGYQTPATNAPYGVVEDRKDKTWSPSDWFDASQKNKTRN
ncbi:hypothetical protein [Ancylobacter terrae]|uniref:hypothetical protein n=1 Tax=Ancylobacter sp. sgz301288 TaxID=3342077 RepID=UPI00385EB574